jgi:lipopolysaccharide transport system permease protein
MKKSAASGDEETWDLVITPNDKLLSFDFKELLQYKDLIGLLVRRDFVAIYKQTVLGPIWFLFQPLMSTLMYMFVFGSIAKLGTDGIPQPLFYFSGTMLWTLFATILQKSSDTFINNAGIYGKVYFPRFSMPIVYTVNSFFTFSIQFVFMLVFYFIYLLGGYQFHPTWWILATPLFVLQLALLGLGIGIIISTMTTKYRDLRNLVSFGLSLMMFATPIVYPLSNVPEKWKFLFNINPVTPVVEMFRFAFLGNGSHSLKMWLISIAITFIVFWFGMIIFNHNERTFIDVV